MTQFGRRYELIVSNPKTGEAVVIEPPLQIEFDLEKQIDNRKKINDGLIRVYNLSKETRAKFEGIKYPQVILKCGYVGTETLATVFTGQAVSISSNMSESGEIVTSFVVGETFIQLHDILEPQTIPAGKTVGDVIKAVVANMQNVSLGTLTGVGVKKQLVSGYPIVGTPKQVFDTLAKSYRLQWRCDKNLVSVRDDGGTFQSPEMEVFEFDNQTGLIGIPSYMDKTVGKAEEDGTGLLGAEFKALINPLVTVGDLVKLSSTATQLNGVYQIRYLRFKGNFRGADWFMMAECDEIKRNGNN